MKINLLSRLAIISLLTVSMASCIKDDIKELGDAGQPFIKLLEAPTNAIFFEPFTGTKKVSLVSIRREANSEAELNKPVTVTLRLDTAAIRAYNTSTGNTFKLLPDSLFTLGGTGITKTGNLTYQVAFQPGEFAKEFYINLNGTKWNLSEKYAMPFIIENSGGLTITTDHRNALTLISIKNRFDGVYEFSATYDIPADRPADWVKTFTYGYETALATTGPNSVRFINYAYGASGTFLPLMTTAGESGFGATTLDIVFDNNNNVVSVNNPAPDSRNRQFSLIPGGNSYFDPSDKTLYLEMIMTQATFAPMPMHIVMKYLGAR